MNLGADPVRDRDRLAKLIKLVALVSGNPSPARLVDVT
ncbi:hypothetical protein JOD54_002363 [Actinokineospora baliensis]|nr:hypothetical protein [Actinokineospora baliensis]